MEMYYLIIGMFTYSAAIIPEKYTLEQCEAAGKKAEVNIYRCVKAPDNSEYFNCTTLMPHPNNPSISIATKIHCDLKTSGK